MSFTQYLNSYRLEKALEMLTETDMNIIDSYKVKTLKQMKKILIEALNTTILYKTKRSMTSLIDE